MRSVHTFLLGTDRNSQFLPSLRIRCRRSLGIRKQSHLCSDGNEWNGYGTSKGGRTLSPRYTQRVRRQVFPQGRDPPMSAHALDYKDQTTTALFKSLGMGHLGTFSNKTLGSVLICCCCCCLRCCLQIRRPHE